MNPIDVERNMMLLKKELETIYAISTILSSSYEKNETLFEILNTLESQLDMTRGMILLFDSISEELYIEASIGLSRKLQEKVRYKIDEGIVGKSFQSGEAILVKNIEDEPLFLNRTKRETKTEISFFAVPIKDLSETFGVLALDKNIESIFSYDEELNFLEKVASLLAQFIKKSTRIEYEKREQKEEKILLEKEVKRKYHFEGLIGISPAMKYVFDSVKMASETDTPVLIRGELGTGKKIIAKTIHYNSSRANKPFFVFDCQTTPSELIETELFGYEKGAFMGRILEKKGKFETASGGSILLDNITFLPLSTQLKLLRVIQEKKIEKIGSHKMIDVDVKIMASSIINIEDEINRGIFRLDLYHRLNSLSIFIPPIRKRKEDIPLLAKYFLNEWKAENEKELKLAPSAIKLLLMCSWPDNVRGLEACIHKVAEETENTIIEFTDFPCKKEEFCLGNINGKLEQTETYDIQKEPYPIEAEPEKDDELQDFSNKSLTEKEKIIQALKNTGWVQAKAARLLNMTVRQINYRIKKYHIEIKKL